MQSYRQIHLKNFNRIALLNYIRRHGSATKTSLSEVTGLTFMAIKNILEELMALQLIRQDDYSSSATGHKSATYRINENYGYTVGLHINVYETRAAVMNLNGEILARKKHRDPAVHSDQKRFIDSIADLVNQTIEESGVPREQLIGLGVAVPGPVNPEAGMVLTPPNFPSLHYMPIGSVLQNKLRIPTLVEKDANAIALGEYWYGAGSNRPAPNSNLVYIDADMGIGSGLIIGGELYRSSNFQAGEFGHITLDLNGPPCNCGNKGCLEAMGSALAIQKNIRAQLAKYPEHPLYPIRNSFTISDVLQCAMDNDVLCISTLNQSADYMGKAINTLNNLLDPSCIVLGGMLTDEYKAYFDIVRNTISHKYFRADQQSVLVKAKLGKNSGVIGAGELVAENFFTELVGDVFFKKEQKNACSDAKTEKKARKTERV